ncbi:MAG TPA: substrate-binding domain-containing protein [Actinoplanes sp.]|jgi:D-xylose transport system substrate-binding protein
MRRALIAAAATGLLAITGAAGCTDGGDTATGSGSKGGRSGAPPIGIILPDTSTSQRWKVDDPKYLKAAFDAAGVAVDMQNAQGDKARFASLADKMINDGVKVLMIVNLDSPTGTAALAKARRAGIKTIDYDRLTLGGGADYYVSFDNVKVGELQGQGLIACLSAQQAVNPIVAELNGSPTDNNATLFKQGYDSKLQPLYDDAKYMKGPDQAVPDWINSEGGKIFEQMLQQWPRIRGVVAANDGLANAVIGVLKKNGMNGKVPVTGQDATVDGLRNILTGDQCLTVYKAIRPEAEAAANLAVSLYRGEQPTAKTVGQPIGQIKDPESGAYVPFVSLTPELITKGNIQHVIDDGFADAKDVCRGDPYDRLCEENNIN